MSKIVACEASRFTPEELAFLSSESGWPLDILTDPTKQPRIVHTVEELKRATFFEDFVTFFFDRLSLLHFYICSTLIALPNCCTTKTNTSLLLFFFETDECVVLPNGVHLLGLQDVIPKDFTDLIKKNNTVLGLIESFTEEMYGKYQGKICYVKKDGKDDEPDIESLKGQLQ